MRTAKNVAVTLKVNGVAKPVEIECTTGEEEYNYARVVFKLPQEYRRDFITPTNSGEADIVYQVTVSNLTKKDGSVAADVNYTVTAINGYPGYPNWNGDQRAIAVSEWYAPSKDTYFISPIRDDAANIDELASSLLYRTWRGFYAWESAENADVGAVSVCRWFFGAPISGHFYSARQSDCDSLRAIYGPGGTQPGVAVEETYSKFYVMPATASGGCDPKYQAVYRLYNAQKLGNHRYIAHPSDRREMIARGWIDEGVAWCSPRKKEMLSLDLIPGYSRDHMWN
jgi:hypothetical protein